MAHDVVARLHELRGEAGDDDRLELSIRHLEELRAVARPDRLVRLDLEALDRNIMTGAGSVPIINRLLLYEHEHLAKSKLRSLRAAIRTRFLALSFVLALLVDWSLAGSTPAPPDGGVPARAAHH